MFYFLVLGASGSKDSSAKVSLFHNVSSREGGDTPNLISKFFVSIYVYDNLDTFFF